MALGTSPQFAVWVNLQGQVNPSVNRSIGTTTKMLKGLQMQAAAVNKTLAVVGKTVAAMAAVAGGLLAIGSIAGGLEQSVNLARQNEQIQEQLLVLLKNERLLRGQNLDLALKDQKAIVAQSEALQQQTGIYKNVFEQGAMIFAQTHRTGREIESLQNSMANLLVSQKMQGKSAEELTQIYTAVGKAIQTGMARNLNSVGVFLTAQEKQLLMFNARVASFTGDYSANIKIIEDAINRTYGGMAAARRGTLLGQADIAMANMRESMERMGDALLPVQLRLQIIFTKIIPLVEPIITRIAFLIDSVLKRHQTDLDNWVGYIQRTVIPVMVNWINKGWAGLITAFHWFKENSWWIMPVLKGVAEGFAVMAAIVGVVTVAVTGLTSAFAALANPFTWLFGGSMAAGAFAENLLPLREWALGTKVLDPKNKGYPNVFKRQQRTTNPLHPGWGSALRAQPIQTGWYTQLNKNLQDWWDKFGKPKILEWWADLVNWWSTTGLPLIDKTVKVVTDFITPTVKAWFSALIDIFVDLIKTKMGLGAPAPEGAPKAGQSWWDWFTGGGKTTHQHIYGADIQSGVNLGMGALKAARTALGTSNIPASIRRPGDVNITHYGGLWDPWRDTASLRGKGGWDNQITHPYTGAGTLTSVAMMQGLASKWGLRKGDSFTYVTPSGQRSSFIYEDVVPEGYTKHGVFHPYKDLRMDIYDPYNQFKGLPGGGHIEDIQHHPLTPWSGHSVAKNDITINYNVTHHHHGDDQSNQVASVHRRHMDNLKRMIEENDYRSNREDFTSGVYV